MAKKKMTLEEKLEEAIIKDVPYEVPDNWIFVKLEYLGKWGSGGTPSRKHPEYYEGTIPWIKTGELNNGYIYDTEEKITNEAIKKSSAKIFVKGSVLLAMYGATIGKVAILGVDATTNQACAAIECNEELVDNKFMFYYLLSQKDNFIELGKGGAQPNISQMIIKEYECPVPPLKEQQRIVDRIESLFEKLDKAKALIEEARDGFEKRKSAIFEKAFRGELTKDWREKRGLSKEYKTYILKDLLKPMTNKKPNLAEEYFRYIDIESIDNKNQVVGNPKIVESIKAPSRASREVIKGDVVFSTVRPYLKNIAYITEDLEECIASTGFYICRCKKILDSKFLYRLLCSEKVLNYYTSLMKGDNSPSIRKGEFEGLKIELPPLEEQNEIVRISDKLLKEESKVEELTALEEQIELIKKSILAKAFRGELGTNCEEDESALELLKEILNT